MLKLNWTKCNKITMGKSLDKYEAKIAKKFSNYDLKTIFGILEDYEIMQKRLSICNKSQHDTLLKFCDYLNKTGSAINESEIEDYYLQTKHEI